MQSIHEIECHAPGDRCLGCQHHTGQKPICSHAPKELRQAHNAALDAAATLLRSSRYILGEDAALRIEAMKVEA
jgi:hypothetical protein